MLINGSTMIRWILSRPAANVLPLAAALKLVGEGRGGISNVQVPDNKLLFGLCCCVLSEDAGALVGIMNQPVEANEEMDSACVGAKIRGIESI